MRLQPQWCKLLLHPLIPYLPCSHSMFCLFSVPQLPSPQSRVPDIYSWKSYSTSSQSGAGTGQPHSNSYSREVLWLVLEAVRDPTSQCKMHIEQKERKYFPRFPASYFLLNYALPIFYYSTCYSVASGSSLPLIVNRRAASSYCHLHFQQTDEELEAQVCYCHWGCTSYMGYSPVPPEVCQIAPTHGCKRKMGKWLWCMWAPCLGLPHLWSEDVS